MSTAARSPTRVVLIGVVLLAVSLTGIPFLVSRRLPETIHSGVVVDGRGFGVADAAVYLFSEEHLQLVEETRTGPSGNYAFHLDAAGARILVRPPATSGLLDAWSPDAETSPGPHAFVLPEARPLTVRVQDAAGTPVAGAEVRVYDARPEPSVISLRTTGADGRARLSAPPRAHVVAFGPAPVPLARWRFDLPVPASGAELELTLPPGRWVRGLVRDAAGPLEGIVLVTREPSLEGGWNGFTRSDAQGRFALPASLAPTELRALDPAGGHLPGRLVLAAGGEGSLELELEKGQPLVVRTSRNGLPLGARIYAWTPESGTWSWGLRAGGAGRTRLSVASRFGLRAEPFDPVLEPLEAWDVPYEEGLLSLEAPPR